MKAEAAGSRTISPCDLESTKPLVLLKRRRFAVAVKTSTATLDLEHSNSSDNPGIESSGTTSRAVMGDCRHRSYLVSGAFLISNPKT